MPASVVTLRPGIYEGAYASGKYVVDATPAATNINCGFVPQFVFIMQATDRTNAAVWSSDMAAATCLNFSATGVAAVATNGITSVAQTDGTNMGFQHGTDASIATASKTYSWWAFR